MKVVVCPDKFKGTLTAWQVVDIISGVINKIEPSAEVVKKPMADGGDGTMDLVYGYSNKKVGCDTFDAVMRPISSTYAILDNKIAVIEMSQSVGLAMLDSKLCNPEITSSFGFGMVIKNAIDNGFREFILGIGGSATNDCGIGMLSALGAEFYNTNGDLLNPVGGVLSDISSFDFSKLKLNIENCSFKVACDVTNPLFGENGATQIYAPQKGADKYMVERLEQGVIDFYNLVIHQLGRDMNKTKGAGAAGGVGAAIECFLGGELVSGAMLIAELIDLEDEIKSADLIITGEGKIDHQTTNGKLIDVVSGLANKYDVDVIAYCGISSCELPKMAVYPIVRHGVSVEQSLSASERLLAELVELTILNHIK